MSIAVMLQKIYIPSNKSYKNMANVVELKLFQEIFSFGVQWGNSLLFVQSTLS